jgi:uncharacterized ubiquitin-like protein YukD
MIDFFSIQIEDICRTLIPKSINGIQLIYSINVITYTQLDFKTNKPNHYVEITIDITHRNRSLLDLALFSRRIGYCTELKKLSDGRERARVKNKLRRGIKDAVSEIIQILNIQDSDI